uniref:Helix-turn-helix domain-containing protein n=1 Tax=Bosea sp. NBC_00436 TaxID=2969620 RepID=A0A9E8CP76_9HYPH
MTPAQCRAARGLIDWTQTRLAEAAGVSLSTVRDFETGKRQPLSANVQAMRAAIEAAGVIFVMPGRSGGGGVRLAHRPRS